MRKILVISLIIILFFNYSINAEFISEDSESFCINNLENINSIRNEIENVVIVSDSDPYFGIIGAYIACWYDKNDNISGLLPFLVQSNKKLTNNQELFLNQYLKTKNQNLLVLGEKIFTNYSVTEIIGTPSEVSIEAAMHVFSQASCVLIIPYNSIDAYQLSLIASPLASYLNIPVLIFDDNQLEIQNVCNNLQTNNAIVIGDVQIQLSNINITILENEEDVQNFVITAIKQNFQQINYITLTNPSDTIPEYLQNYNEETFIDHVENKKIILLGKEINLKGVGTKEYNITIPDNINKVKIQVNICNITKILDENLKDIVPIIYIYFYDPQGNTVAYSNSLAYDIGKTYVETLTCNAPGTYNLVIKIYNGMRGGFFIPRGFSSVDTDIQINVNISTLEKPHMPLIPKLSIAASYLTSAHGGLIIADPNFELTTDDYENIASGSGTGPWYNENLHEFNNEKVNYTIDKINNTLSQLNDHNMLNDYLNGPAWLAILAGTNMIPMYYYSSEPVIPEKGLPSDNPYSLNWNLSVGRIIGWDIQDVSLLISRTLFYEDICDEPNIFGLWHDYFSFIFGEGFGETGGIFHQIPYSFEIRQYGFKPRIFGNLKNSRQITTLLKAYTSSNYIEYLGHADWFWYTPSLYGIDYLSKAVDVAHAKNWIYEKPSIFLTSACLMGRVDGIPPNMNIGLTMLHAGCNSFIGATRETGSEAGLTTFENHLIVDDYSVGEALRGEKTIDKEPPTYYVRTLYGDPAFNPYEPNNGFSNQGRPILIT